MLKGVIKEDKGIFTTNVILCKKNINIFAHDHSVLTLLGLQYEIAIFIVATLTPPSGRNSNYIKLTFLQLTRRV